MKHYCIDKVTLAGYVNDLLVNSRYVLPLTMTISLVPFEGYCVETATKELLDDTEHRPEKFFSKMPVNIS